MKTPYIQFIKKNAGRDRPTLDKASYSSLALRQGTLDFW